MDSFLLNTRALAGLQHDRMDDIEFSYTTIAIPQSVQVDKNLLLNDTVNGQVATMHQTANGKQASTACVTDRINNLLC